MSQRFTKHFSNLVSKGWFVNAHDPNSVVSDDFAQFFTYWPHKDHLTLATMSVEKYYQFIDEVTPLLPEHSLTSSSLAQFVCESGFKTFGDYSKSDSELLGMALAIYMRHTKTGAIYESQMGGRAFGFLAVMYPTNKKQTDFAVRPSILAPLENVLSVQEAMSFAEQTMQYDRDAGKKEYFKYIKKKR